MVCQILIGMGFAADADLHPGEILGADLGDDGLDAVVPAGGAVAANPQPARRQGDIVKKNDDPLGRDIEIRRKLQHRFAGQIHISLRLQQEDLSALVIDLTVQSLKLQLIRLAAQLVSQNVQRPEACIVPGVGVFSAGVAQSDDEPAFVVTAEHGLEQVSDGGAAVDMLDGPGKHGSHIQELDLTAGGIANLGDGVQEQHFLDDTGLQTLVGGAGQNAVGGAGIDLLGAELHQGVGGVAQRTGGVHHIIVQNAGLALDVADDVHDLALVGSLAALVHDGQVHVNLLSEVTGTGDRADVGRNNNELIVVAGLLGELVHVVLHEGGGAQQVIQGNVEEALNLAGVQVHGQDTVGAGHGDHVGHQLGGDGIAALGLAVLTGVAEVGDDGGDAAGGSTAAGIDHDQQLHQVVIDGLAGGLNQENVGAADGLLQGNGSFAVGKSLHNTLAHGQAQLLADGLSKLLVGVAAENLDIISVCGHCKKPHFNLFLPTDSHSKP